MLDSRLRELKELMLLPLARCLPPIHPISITFVALFFGLVAAFLLSQQQYAWGFVCWATNRALDGLDGTTARLCDKQSDLGAYLDILFDFVVYAALPVALVLGQPSVGGYLSLAFLLASFYINAASWMYLAAILEKRKQGTRWRGELTSVTMPAGLIGGAETIILYSLFIIWPQQMIFLFTFMGALVLITVGQRLVWAVTHLD